MSGENGRVGNMPYRLIEPLQGYAFALVAFFSGKAAYLFVMAESSLPCNDRFWTFLANLTLSLICPTILVFARWKWKDTKEQKDSNG